MMKMNFQVSLKLQLMKRQKPQWKRRINKEKKLKTRMIKKIFIHFLMIIRILIIFLLIHHLKRMNLMIIVQMKTRMIKSLL